MGISNNTPSSRGCDVRASSTYIYAPDDMCSFCRLPMADHTIGAAPSEFNAVITSHLNDSVSKGTVHLAHLVAHFVDRTTIDVSKNRFGETGRYVLKSLHHTMSCACKTDDDDLTVICSLHAQYANERVTLALKNASSERVDASRSEPIPMILFCPSCHTRHIDESTFALKSHHTHACQSCGMVWRPALVATIGVRFLPGFKDA